MPTLLTWAGPRSLEEIQRLRPSRIWYSRDTVWWSAIMQPQLVHPVFGFPCDPQRSPILTTEDIAEFFAVALRNPERYGAWGLQTLMAAHHGNLIDEIGIPTCLGTWPEVDALVNLTREK